MRRVMIVLGVLAIVAFVASAEQATADSIGTVLLEGGNNQTNPYAATHGAIWMDTGSGPQIIPCNYTTATDINFEILGGTTPSNLQLLDNPAIPQYTSIWLLSNPDPDGNGNVPNSASWDMNQVANGEFLPLATDWCRCPRQHGIGLF